MRLERHDFDADYIRRLVAGDAETERHFTDYFGQLLVLKLRPRLRSAAQVEDARQETFLRVLCTLKEKAVATAGSLGAFVNSVCNNVLFECIGRRAYEQDWPRNTTKKRPPAADSRWSPTWRARVRAALLGCPT